MRRSVATGRRIAAVKLGKHDGRRWATVLVPLILFLATIIRSSFGFGEALVAVPLLALVTPVEIAVPVAVLASITVALIAVVQDWHLIHFRDASRLVLSTIVGIPIGLWLLKVVPEPVIKGVLAVIIIAFSTYSLLSSRQQELKTTGPPGCSGLRQESWVELTA